MPRSRTHSPLKWMLNERAALEGRLQAIDAEMARLQRCRDQAQATLDSLNAVAMAIEPSMASIEVKPVNARGRYGKRGNLSQWLRRVLREAHPQSVQTPALLASASAVFGLTFATDEQRQHFHHNCLRRRLFALAQRGEIEQVGAFQASTSNGGAWRWLPRAPTWEDVQDASVREVS